MTPTYAHAQIERAPSPAERLVVAHEVDRLNAQASLIVRQRENARTVKTCAFWFIVGVAVTTAILVWGDRGPL
jgi:hypothetical protein